MASHHHHLPHCQNHVPTTTAATNCCYSHCCTQPNHPPPPPPPPPHPPLQQQSPMDPLLQTLISFLQQQQPPQPNVSSLYHNKPHTPKNHHQDPHFQPQNLHFQQLALSSLLQRIITLESSLHYLSASSTDFSRHRSHPLRDAAARVIQTHFRAFLARRSRTLRQLKELAFIKTSFISIKSSVSQKTHFDYDVVSHKVMNLLLKLDSIQGGDPMIRDGKRSISRDLVNFLEFIDGLAVKRLGLLCRSSRNVRFIGNSNKSRALKRNDARGAISRNQKEMLENLKDRVEKIREFSRVCEDDGVEFEGFQQFVDDDGDEEDESPKSRINGNHSVSKLRNGVSVHKDDGRPRVKKSVSFAENGNVYRIFRDDHESVSNGEGSFSDGSDSGGDHGDAMENQYNGTEGAQLEDGGSMESGGGEKHPRNNRRGEVDYNLNCYCYDPDGSLVFSAPMPVKMEPRADLTKKRKDVRIVE